jgi:ATP synthase F1 delta subunit
MSAKVSRRALAEAITAKLIVEPKQSAHWMQVLGAYLVEHNMINDADMIINDIAHELYVQAGQLVVEVTSVKSLSDSAREQLTSYLKRETNATTVQIHESTNPDLIGGLVAKTADAELDASVRTQLRTLAAIA